MISRYSHPEMTRIFEDKQKFIAWLRVEKAVNDEWVRTSGIPRKVGTTLSKKLQSLIHKEAIDPDHIAKLEEETKHDVLAFTAAVSERLGDEGKYLHFGLTSSDVVDTGLCLLIQNAGKLISAEIEELLEVLKKKAKIFQNTPCIGRTHGMFAEPTSFGLKFLGWYCEWRRNQARWTDALEQMRVGKLTGAVGVSPHFDSEFESRCLKELGLISEAVSTQVLPRDRHAQLFNTFGIMAGSIERIAVELRHLQRSEVSEVMEGFKKGQKGSSAMPHKRNPISSENLSGCARLIRGYAASGLENIALWHERDISHSSVERVIIPDTFILMHYMLKRMTKILEGLVVDELGVERNLKQAGSIVYSGHFLLELVKKGASRQEAYRWVQQCAHEALDSKGKKDFLELLSEHQEIKKFLTFNEVKKIGSISYQFRNLNQIYKRAFR